MKINIHHMYRHFLKAVKAAGLKDVTFHTLRHTTASHLVMSGAPLVTVQEIMRHKTITMTLRYAHLAPEHKQAAVDALENALNSETKPEEKTA